MTKTPEERTTPELIKLITEMSGWATKAANLNDVQIWNAATLVAQQSEVVLNRRNR